MSSLVKDIKVVMDGIFQSVVGHGGVSFVVGGSASTHAGTRERHNQDVRSIILYYRVVGSGGD